MTMNARNDWWRHAVVYEVYPRSFQDSNGDGIGDLDGITARLPYLKGLGVDAVWIAPFFKSPMADFGYDVSDYLDVDPMFGSMRSFETLVECAHSLGLKVMIDLVLSHSSDRHPWFAQSRADHSNERADWYVWADAKADGTPPNNWLSIFGGSAWQWDTRREQYYLHNFLASQPDLNFHTPAVQDALLDVARFWLVRGVDGFRLDTVNFYTHDKLLRDNPPQPPGQFAGAAHRSNPYAWQRHLHDKTQPENLGFIERLRTLCDGFPGTVLLGEIGDDRQYKTLADYTRGDKRLQMAYVFRLLERSCSARHLAGVLEEYLRDASRSLVCWSVGNHDVERVASRWAGIGGTPRQRAELAAALLLALPGAKCIYQGEELGLTEADVPFELLQDPFGITMWPQKMGRDGCRTPMPWTRAPGAGFTIGRPWLPVAEEHLPLAVREQVGDPQSLHAFYVGWLEWHRQERALHEGALLLMSPTDQVLAFERVAGNETLVCLFNLSDQPAAYRVAAGAELIAERSVGAQLEDGHAQLPACGMLFARITQKTR